VRGQQHTLNQAQSIDQTLRRIWVWVLIRQGSWEAPASRREVQKVQELLSRFLLGISRGNAEFSSPQNWAPGHWELSIVPKHCSWKRISSPILLVPRKENTGAKSYRSSPTPSWLAPRQWGRGKGRSPGSVCPNVISLTLEYGQCTKLKMPNS
jgi:hypothetical protein